MGESLRQQQTRGSCAKPNRERLTTATQEFGAMLE
jgi:hypothetical protein